MTQMLELSDKDFKVAVIKMFQTNNHQHLKQMKKYKVPQRNRRYKEELITKTKQTLNEWAQQQNVEDR